MDEETKVIKLHDYLDRITDKSDAIADEYKAYDFTRDAEPGGSSNDLWQEEVKAWADMQTIESLFFTEDWVFIVVDLMANKISSQPLYVMRRTMEEGVEAISYADGHPLNQLIESPNPMQDYHSWMYNTVVNYGLLGNAMIWYSKANQWLVSLRSALVDIAFDNKGAIRAYNYTSGDNSLEEGKDRRKTVEYLAETIIHVRRPNPASLLYGLSPFMPGRKSILFSRYSTDYLNSFYLKQATPGMVLEMDKQVNEQQALRQLRSFELAYTGRKNQRRTMILPKGMKASPVSHSIADQKLVDLINMNRETILSLLKVPKHEVGLQEAGSLGSEEYKTALRNFWEATLIPTCRMIEGSLNKFFAKQLGSDFFFKFDLDNVEALKDDQLSKATLAKEMLAGGMSVNEVRSKVWDLKPSPLPADDTPYVSVPKVPAFGAPPTANTAPVATTEPPIKTDPLKSIETPTIDKGASLMELVQRRNEGWVERYVKTMDEVVRDKEGKAIYELALETLVSMAEDAAEIIPRFLRETKSTEIKSKRELRKALVASADRYQDEFVDKYTTILKNTVETGYDSQIEFIFNDKDKEKIAALRKKDAEGRREILRDRGLDTFDNVSKTRTEAIMASITQGTKRGESISQIISRVAKELGDFATTQNKADTIARTETLTAVSIGQGAALKNAQKVIPGLQKAWLNAGDARVRDSHVDVQGETVDAEDDFSNGLRWPRDVGGPPEETINCRCTLVMLPPGEKLNV